ncbi:MAG: hypothetical protein M3X11_07700 [Acidobacteriota bacterium]|nr:hypothetical protein [Acidobacteriota bacterium]
MSVKFEIADWRFELTLKELICQPIEGEKKKAKAPRWRKALKESADGELRSAELLPESYGREQAVGL